MKLQLAWLIHKGIRRRPCSMWEVGVEGVGDIPIIFFCIFFTHSFIQEYLLLIWYSTNIRIYKWNEYEYEHARSKPSMACKPSVINSECDAIKIKDWHKDFVWKRQTIIRENRLSTVLNMIGLSQGTIYSLLCEKIYKLSFFTIRFKQ